MLEIEANSLDDFKADMIIDARSQSEYFYSHIPNARNFFALNDEEYKQIGTIYKQVSKTKAKILGSSFICNNASKHILNITKELKIGSKIVIYCARGGQRSNSLGLILSEVGYRVAKIKGGYKAYRRIVLDFLDEDIHTKFITLFGNTGCGKTELIKDLNPSIDLENLANHLGSSFGKIKGEQPSMKAFQNLLAKQLNQIKNKKACFIEGESKRIGDLILPGKLYSHMQEGVAVYINSPLDLRIKRVLKEYENISESYFHECVEKISPYIEKDMKKEIINKFYKQDFYSLAEILLKNYYDKVYKKPQKVDYTIFHEDKEETLEKLRRIYEKVL